MTETPGYDDPPVPDDEQYRVQDALTSRRRFVEAAGAAGVLVGVGSVAAAQQEETPLEFGGEVAGWQGRSPDAIADETNPTLELEAGTEYEVVWENLDGQLHDFVIQDADGEEIVGTDIFDEQGATHTLTFTASEEMASYVCTVHPTSMVGDVQVGEDDGDAGGTVDRYVPVGPSVGVQQVADGPLVNPVTLRSVPREEDVHLVVDQTGQVYVLDGDQLVDDPVLDLGEDVVVLEETEGGFDRDPGFDERGLLGLDFHPDFEENGLLYVRYSSRDPVTQGELIGPDGREFPEDWDHVEVLSEFRVEGGEAGDDDADDADDGSGDANSGDDGPGGGTNDGSDGVDPAADLQVDPDSERVLLEVPSPQFNHNGGEVVFGPDGYCYASLGDGGGGSDADLGHVDDWYDGNDGGNAQNVEANLLGAVLRIDVDQEGEDRPYGIPDDNPLVDTAGHDEIFAYGLRNPWRMSFDGERLIAADVGQALFEEVDVVENGGNYGWNVKEGFHCFDPDDPTTPPADCPDAEPDEDPYDGSEFVDPVLEYPHLHDNEPVGISITGGYVYEGEDVEELQGRYVFGDWSVGFVEPQGRLFVADPDDDSADVDDGDGEPDAGDSQDGDESQDEDDAQNGDQAGDGDAGEDDRGEQPEPEPEDDVPLPEEQPWQWEEVLVEGGENQQLNRFVQAFGRDDEGEMYVLASRTGRLESPGGEVYRLVGADEGEDVEPPDLEIPDDTGEGAEGGSDDEQGSDEPDTENDGGA